MLCSAFGYLEAYKKEIESGRYVVGKWMEKNLELIEEGLNEKKFFYNPEKAEKAIGFIENYIHFVEGKASNFKLEIWQKYITACIFGLVDKEDIRQFKEFVLIVGRKVIDLHSNFGLRIGYADFNRHRSFMIKSF